MAQREKVILEAEDRASAALRKAGGAFDELGNEVDDTSKKLDRAEKSADRASGGMGRMGKVVGGLALGVAAAQVARLGASAVQLAVDAEEASAAFDTTFGPATDRASAFVEEFGLKAGFSTGKLEQMLAVTGNVVQGIGATETESAALAESMATLAGDVASFSNAQGGAEAVMMALQSAINGEREALKTYGLALSEAEVQQMALTQTGKTHADQLTRLEKANATVALAYEKAGKAVGDLDRTQDSAANTMRRLRAMTEEAGAEIGGKLLPALDRVLPSIEKMIPAIAEAAAALADGFASAAPAITWVAERIPDIADGLKLISNSAINVGAGIAAFFAMPGSDARASLQATADQAAAANDLNNVLREFREEAIPGADAAAQYANAVADLASKGSLTEEALLRVGEASGVSASRQQDALITLRRYALENGWAADEVQMLEEAIGENAVAAGTAGNEYDETERLLARYGQTSADVAEVTDDELSPAMANLKQRMAEAKLEAQRVGDAFADDLLADMEDFQTGLEGAVDEIELTLDEWEANFNERYEQQAEFWSNLATLYNEGFDDLADELREGGVENAGLAEQAANDLEEAARLDNLVRDTETELDRWSNAIADAATGNDSVIDTYRQFGIDIARAVAMGFDEFDLASSLDRLIDEATGAAAPSSTGTAPATSSGEPLVAPGGQIAFATGGIVPGGPRDEVPAILHGTEAVIPPEGSGGRAAFTNQLARELAGIMGGGSGGGALKVSIEVNQAGQVIGASVEAQSDNLEATVERLVRR